MTVIDLLISGGSGLELCRQLKQRSGAPILAISSTLDTVILRWRPARRRSCRSRWTRSSLSRPSRTCSAPAPFFVHSWRGQNDRVA